MKKPEWHFVHMHLFYSSQMSILINTLTISTLVKMGILANKNRNSYIDYTRHDSRGHIMFFIIHTDHLSNVSKFGHAHTKFVRGCVDCVLWTRFVEIIHVRKVNGMKIYKNQGLQY